MKLSAAAIAGIAKLRAEGRVVEQGQVQAPAPRPVADMLTEAEFTGMVLDLARSRGWLTLHLRPARTAKGWRTAVAGDGVGWPDVFMVRGNQALAAELKVRTRPTAAQLRWRDALQAAGIPWYCWRPSDWPEIATKLA